MSISRFIRSASHALSSFFFEPERGSDWWSPPIASSQSLLRPTAGPAVTYRHRPRSQRHGSWKA